MIRARVRPRVTRTQLALLSAITKSASLKRRLVEATEPFVVGTFVRVPEPSVPEAGRRQAPIEGPLDPPLEPMRQRLHPVGRVLGSGLIGVVHVAEDERGRAIALKHARAHLAFFREALSVERSVASLIEDTGALGCAKILGHQDHVLAKELVSGPTLAELLVRGVVDRTQATALEGVLDVVRYGLDEWGIALDVSPKNLAWEDRWVLLDAGPKLRIGETARIARARSFEGYVEAHRAKLASGPSVPSAVSVFSSREDADDEVERHAFVRDLWRWFPLDDDVDASAFLVDVDGDAPSDEVVLVRDRSGSISTLGDVPELLLRAAELAWTSSASEPRERPSESRGRPQAKPQRKTQRKTQRDSLVGLAPSATGRLYRDLHAPAEAARVPSPPIRAYSHWRDVLAPEGVHAPVDLYCHELLGGDSDAREGAATGAVRVRLPTWPRTFAELECRVVRGSSRGYVFVPGFRAGIDATTPLIDALVSRGHAGVFVSAYLGARNEGGDAIVTAGRWEVPLLVQVVDYALRCLDVRAITLFAASHGAAAAMDVAAFHPGIDELVVDSPLANPLELYFHVAAARGQSRVDASDVLRTYGLSPEPRSFHVPSRAGLRSLALRPTPDVLTDLCGFAGGSARVVDYAGPHAATMRHDARRRGVPADCLDAIDAFLARPAHQVEVEHRPAGAPGNSIHKSSAGASGSS